jgi:hypothetical protein
LNRRFPGEERLREDAAPDVEFSEQCEITLRYLLALADRFDAFMSAMFLVDEAGSIVHANVSHSMISEAMVLRALAADLVLSMRRPTRPLLDSFSAAARGDAALGKMGIAVPLEAFDEKRYLAHVLPLT